MKRLLLLSAVLLADPALARNNTPPPFQQGGSTSSSTATATAAAAAAAVAGSKAINTNVISNSATGGRASSSATGGDARSSQSVSVDASMRDRLQAPGLGAYAAASGPCIGVSTSVGLSFPGFGGMAGRTEIEDECQIREAARILASIGDVPTAQRLILGLPSVRAALAPPPAAPAPAASAPAPTQVAARPSRCAIPTAEELRTGMC